MRNRLRWGAFLLGVIILAVVAWELLATREPVYQGKELSEHLRAGGPEAEEAVRQIGTNAIPVLLRLIQARDSSIKLKIYESLQRLNIVQGSPHSAVDQWVSAIMGFHALGTNAEMAVPALVLLYRKHLYAGDGIQYAEALGSIGPAAKASVPDLISGLDHTNAMMSEAAVRALRGIHSEPDLVVPALMKFAGDAKSGISVPAIKALSSFETNTPVVISFLIGLATNQNLRIRWSAVCALGSFRGEQAAIFPVLTNALCDIDSYVRRDAAIALVNLGTNARAAIPALLKAYTDEKKENRPKRRYGSNPGDDILEAITKIDPDAAAQLKDK